MDNFRNTNINNIENATVIGDNRLLRSSFSWMSLAMLLTTLAALLFSQVPALKSLLIVETDTILKPTLLGYVAMFSPLLFVLGIRFGLEKLSYPVLVGLFVAYSFINGMAFSSLFFMYNINSIVNVFLSTTALFAVMAIAGYTTKTDLTKLGSLLFIGLIGIVIASLINLFMQSAGFDYIISILGVIIFTGLTAYDVQKIKNLGYQVEGSSLSSKMGIVGALTLYLDFINLFLFLLRLFGGRKD